MLRQIIQTLLDQAVRNLNVPMKKKVKGNLHIAIAITKSRTPGVDQDVHLSLSRDKTYPSLTEWKTTLANFPYYVPYIEPIQFVDSDRRFALRAKLPTRQNVAEQMTFPTSTDSR